MKENLKDEILSPPPPLSLLLSLSCEPNNGMNQFIIKMTLSIQEIYGFGKIFLLQAKSVLRVPGKLR